MAWLDLVPRERFTGATTARGAITKAGNSRARRVLDESACTYRLPARIGHAFPTEAGGAANSIRAVGECLRASPGRSLLVVGRRLA